MQSINNIPIWKENENRIARQQAMHDFMDANAAIADTLTGAGTTQSEGLSEIVAQSALKRMKAEAAAKNAKQTAASAETAARDKELAKVKERIQGYLRVNIVDLKV